MREQALHIHAVIDTANEQTVLEKRSRTRVRCVRGRIEARRESLIHVWARELVWLRRASHDYAR